MICSTKNSKDCINQDEDIRLFTKKHVCINCVKYNIKVRRAKYYQKIRHNIVSGRPRGRPRKEKTDNN